MQKPKLIQRLMKPYKNTMPLGDNPFSFGGGLKNGGLSDEAMSMIRGIFRFDYMGSAEFEWGAVPKALSKIYEYSKLNSCVSFNIECKTRRNNAAIIYVICYHAIAKEVETYLKAKAYDEYNKELYTKEAVGLEAAIDHEGREFSGWLELDNGFFFFIDKEMFENTKNFLI